MISILCPLSSSSAIPIAPLSPLSSPITLLPSPQGVYKFQHHSRLVSDLSSFFRMSYLCVGGVTASPLHQSERNIFPRFYVFTEQTLVSKLRLPPFLPLSPPGTAPTLARVTQWCRLVEMEEEDEEERLKDEERSVIKNLQRRVRLVRCRFCQMFCFFCDCCIQVLSWLGGSLLLMLMKGPLQALVLERSFCALLIAFKPQAPMIVNF